jgi:hypothetical protein
MYTEIEANRTDPAQPVRPSDRVRGEGQDEATVACRSRAARSPAAVAELMLLWQK